MSTPRLYQAIQLWNTQLEAVKPFYAVKCNPEPHLLRHLHGAGVGFDCASERELLEVNQISEGADIVYANPCKSFRDISVAKRVGEPMTVVDSVEEVEQLAGYAGGALVRIAVDDSGSAMPFSSKFGAAAADLPRISQAAKAHGLALRGISFHVGSGSADKNSHAAAIHTAYKGLITLGRTGHAGADTIDIGGGYLASFTTQFWATAKSIRAAMMKVNEDSHLGVKWIAEPGRFFAANTFDFYVQVIGKKWSPIGWKYTIDDSIYGQFSNILFDHAAPNWVRISDGGSPRKSSAGIIFGRTCDSVDVIAKAAEMEELEVGDWLWFPSMGAYTRATASEFNGFPKPEIFVSDAADMPTIRDFPVAKGVKRMPPVSAKAFFGEN
jgi:ornithine decarboxylase